MRSQVLAKLRDGRSRCLVMTSVGNMGIDVPHVRVVAAMFIPFTIASLVQMIGRGGRDGHPCVFFGAFRASSASFEHIDTLSKTRCIRDALIGQFWHEEQGDRPDYCCGEIKCSRCAGEATGVLQAGALPRAHANSEVRVRYEARVPGQLRGKLRSYHKEQVRLERGAAVREVDSAVLAEEARRIEVFSLISTLRDRICEDSERVLVSAHLWGERFMRRVAKFSPDISEPSDLELFGLWDHVLQQQVFDTIHNQPQAQPEGESFAGAQARFIKKTTPKKKKKLRPDTGKKRRRR